MINVNPILHECADYTFKHSIGVINSRAARVVSVASIKQHLAKNHGGYHNLVLAHFKTLENFLTTTGRNCIKNCTFGDWKKDWNYELLMAEDYRNDPRSAFRYFPELIDYKSDNTLLFVCYSQGNQAAYLEDIRLNKMPVTSRKELNDELVNLYQELKPKQSMIDERRSLKNRLQVRLKQIWPHLNITVAIFGSSANGLALKDADLDLCIIVPEEEYNQGFSQRKFMSSKSIYDMKSIASILVDMGMKKVEAICDATVPICKFVDPVTNFNCDINTNNVLGIENTRLIHQYLKMDTRIEPFLFAIKHFTKQKDINNTTRGTLSSYAYIIMALHFLMIHYAGPVIPSLQRLPVNCTSKKCNWKTQRSKAVYHANRLIQCDTRFHNCVRIVNTQTNEFDPHWDTDAITDWKSTNFFWVGTLLIEFFHYYSSKNNLHVSIISGDKGLVSYPLKKREREIVVQDPFLVSKNVAQTCSPIGLKTMMDEFARAAKLLEYGFSFDYVCDQRYNLPRQVDKRTIEYKRMVFERKNEERRVRTRKSKYTFDGDSCLKSMAVEEAASAFRLDNLVNKKNSPSVSKERVLVAIKKDALAVAQKKFPTKSSKDLSGISEERLAPREKESIPKEKKSPPIKEISPASAFKEDVVSKETSRNKERVKKETPGTSPNVIFDQLPQEDASFDEIKLTTTATKVATGQGKPNKEIHPKATESLKKDRSLETKKGNPKAETKKVEENKKVVVLVKKLLAAKNVPNTNPIVVAKKLGVTNDDLADIDYLIARLVWLKNAAASNVEDLEWCGEEDEAFNHTEEMSNLAVSHRGKSAEFQELCRSVENPNMNKGDPEDRVDIQVYMFNVPIDVEAYQIFSCLQWYGKIDVAEPVGTSNNDSKTWKVHMNIQKKNIHYIQEKMDFGGFTSSIQII